LTCDFSGPNATIKYAGSGLAATSSSSSSSSSSSGIHKPIFGLKAVETAQDPLNAVEKAAQAYFPAALASKALVFAAKTRKEDMSCVRYNPQATVLAAASHDNFIDLYHVARSLAHGKTLNPKP